MRHLYQLVFMFQIFLGSVSAAEWRNQEICSKQFILDKMQAYPELNWLMDDKVELTQEGHNTKTKTSWSLRLSKDNKHYGEFERSVLSLVVLDLILSGTPDAYEKLTSIQKNNKLSKESFAALHDLSQRVLTLFEQNDKQMIRALETALVLGDMGKTPHAHVLASGIQQADHDLFLEEALRQNLLIFPSFNALPSKYQGLIKKVSGLMHFGHVTHLEGTPKNMLGKIMRSGVLQDPRDPYAFALLVHICDVASAAGHTNNQGSLSLTELSYQTLMAAMHALKNHPEAASKAIRSYMETRGNWLDIDAHTYPISVRLGCMLRLYSPEEGRLLVTAWNDLSPSEKNLLTREFDPLKEYPGLTPTYVPAVLLNVWNLKEGTPKDRLDLILKTVLPTLVQYIKDNRSSGVILNFNQVAKFWKERDTSNATDFKLVHDPSGRVSVLEKEK